MWSHRGPEILTQSMIKDLIFVRWMNCGKIEKGSSGSRARGFSMALLWVLAWKHRPLLVFISVQSCVFVAFVKM